MRYFLELSYNGAPFHGWQSQPNASSVQDTIEEALSKLLGKVSITGAGRTDTGVNARKMYAHFDSADVITEIPRFLKSVNSLVGPFIDIRKIIPVSDEAHARFDAFSRTYKYFISYTKNPFLKDFYYFSYRPLDVGLMNQAAKILLDTKDFTSFAKLHSDAKTNICNVTKAEWTGIKEDPEAFDFIGSLQDGIVFTITADRFLRNMVRAIVGTLVEVGNHKIPLEEFNDIIYKKNRCAAGTSVPGNALFLWDVKYSYID